VAAFLKRKWIFILIGLVFVVVVAATTIFFLDREGSPRPTSSSETKIKVLYEKIPGSKNHSPDGTWWGYNQSKIVRFGDRVYTYVIHNDDDPATPSRFTIYKKEGESDWEKGTDFPTSRPGNILVDSTGVLHVFVFEATDMVKNDSLGKLVHYFFPNAAKGDITNYKEGTVVAAKKDIETVNIRVGAAIGADDTMAVGFGLTVWEEDLGQTEQLFFKRSGQAKWTKLTAGTNLGHDFYYPFTLATKSGFHLLPIQDDFIASGEGNIYQIIPYFEYKDGKWQQKIIADLTKHALAPSRIRLLEQSDLFEDSSGKIHVIYKEYLNPDSEYQESAYKHWIKSGSGWTSKEVVLSRDDLGWIRLAEVGEELFYIASSGSGELWIAKVGTKTLTRIDTPQEVQGIYLYVATSKGGSRESEKYVDILMLSGDSRAYPNATNYYVRIPKSEFSKIK
jgi:hypothetical protein